MTKTFTTCILLLTILAMSQTTAMAQLGQKADYCWKDSYGRGVGYIPTGCQYDQQKQGLLCYPACNAGYSGLLSTCWQNCPAGMTDTGADCLKPASYGRGGGYGWQGSDGFSSAGMLSRCQNSEGRPCEMWGAIAYPTCRDGFYAFGANVCSPNCPSNMVDIGVSCQKTSYTRSVTTAGCNSGDVYDAGLCYTPCRTGYNGVGPVCWGTCAGNKDFPYDCAAGCAADINACATETSNQVLTVISAIGNIALAVLTFGGSTVTEAGVRAAADAATAAAGKASADAAASTAANTAAKTAADAAAKSTADAVAKQAAVAAQQTAEAAASKAATSQAASAAAKKVSQTVASSVTQSTAGKVFDSATGGWATTATDAALARAGIQDASKVAVQQALTPLLKNVSPELLASTVKKFTTATFGATIDTVAATQTANAASAGATGSTFSFDWTTLDPTGITQIVSAYDHTICSAPPLNISAPAPTPGAPAPSPAIPPPPPVPTSQIKWDSLPVAATDVSVTSDGTAWIVTPAGIVATMRAGDKTAAPRTTNRSPVAKRVTGLSATNGYYVDADKNLIPVGASSLYGEVSEVAFDAAGSMFIVGAQGSLSSLKPLGTVLTTLPETPERASGIAAGPPHNVWVITTAGSLYRWSANDSPNPSGQSWALASKGPFSAVTVAANGTAIASSSKMGDLSWFAWSSGKMTNGTFKGPDSTPFSYLSVSGDYSIWAVKNGTLYRMTGWK